MLAIAIFAGLSIAAAISSEGFLEADACTHYLYARFAFQQPHYFVNVWGRPVCTTLYAIPAAIGGRLGVRLTSLLVAIGCALVAWRIAADQQYRRPALALIFTLAQPLVFLHSFSELTELPFALMIGVAFWAYQKRRWWAMAILAGFSPLARPEGFGFIILAAVGLAAHRRLRWLALLILPLVLWSYVGWNMYGRVGHWWRWLVDNWPYAAESVYRPGSIFHFVALLPAVTSPLIFPATCLGIWQNLRPGRRDHHLMLVAIIPLLILVAHSVLYALGKLASSGEIRYLLTVAPFWGLLSARGWEWLFERLGLRRPLAWAAIAAILPASFNMFYKVLPLVYDADWIRARRAAWWYQHGGWAEAFPRVAAAHPAIYYFLDISGSDPHKALEWRKDLLAHPPQGTIVIFDPMYAVSNSDANRCVSLNELLSVGWIDATSHVPTIGPGWRVLLSPQNAFGRDADMPVPQNFP